MKMEFKEVKNNILSKATELKACSSEVSKVKESKTLDELLIIVRDNANWCSENNLLSDEESIEYFGYSLSNLFNSGNRNSGDSNSGYRNSGDRNSGNWNSGDRNSGDRNSGDRNSGNWNSGDRNSGDSNSGYRNSGAFCTDNDPKIWLFDKPTKMTVREWEDTEAAGIMYGIDPTIWVNESLMSDEEKEQNPGYETTGGYLKTIPFHDAWGDLWNNLTEEKRKIFTSLPNFNKKKFKEITGISV